MRAVIPMSGRRPCSLQRKRVSRIVTARRVQILGCAFEWREVAGAGLGPLESPTDRAESARLLASRGTPLQARFFDSPSNQVLDAQKEVGSLRVLGDRGRWFVELAPLGVGEYFDTAAWTAASSERM